MFSLNWDSWQLNKCSCANTNEKTLSLPVICIRQVSAALKGTHYVHGPGFLHGWQRSVLAGYILTRPSAEKIHSPWFNSRWESVFETNLLVIPIYWSSGSCCGAAINCTGWDSFWMEQNQKMCMVEGTGLDLVQTPEPSIVCKVLSAWTLHIHSADPFPFICASGV